jgi:hypothetical protein
VTREATPQLTDGVHARRRRHRGCVWVLAGLALLSGCSWILPHPSAVSDKRLAECPLGVLQARKDLPKAISATGIPSPLIIRDRSRSGEDRLIRSGQSVYFVATQHDVDLLRNFGPDMSRHLISIDPAVPLPPTSLWQIEALDPHGKPVASDALLSDPSVVRLRNVAAAGYLEFAKNAQTLTAPLDRATRFALYKADVPDSTRPTTCDAQIRDGDFVFLQAVEPSTWINVTDTGAFYVTPLTSRESPAPADSSRNPRCAQDEERCHTDQNGGLVCAWAPMCVN